jgi:hypothetical protein
LPGPVGVNWHGENKDQQDSIRHVDHAADDILIQLPLILMAMHLNIYGVMMMVPSHTFAEPQSTNTQFSGC